MTLVRVGIVVGLAVALAACGPGTSRVTVSVQAAGRQGEVAPIPGAELTLLPFDIDSVYTALEEKNAPGPAPTQDTVEARYQEFYRADTALLSADSLVAARQATLEGIQNRASPEYREAFAAYEQALKRRDSISAARDSAEARYAPVRESYNRARATWESSAWDGFAQINEKLYAEVSPPQDSAGAEVPFTQRTGPDGTFTVHLQPGPWWVAGRVAVPGSAHEVYRWNVPFTVGQEPTTVELTGENAEIVSTY